MIIKSSWYITNVFLFLYDEWKNKLFHPNYIYNQMFFFSFFPFFTISSNKPYCSILLRTHWTWESDLQWNNHQLLMILALEDEKLQTTHQMERDEEDLVVLCCCWCGLRLNMLFALAKYSSFLCFFAIMILKTFIHYCWFV